MDPMGNFHRYDFASKGYISKLREAVEGTCDVAELIPASAGVQDALSEIRDMNADDRAYVAATTDYIRCLSDIVKGRAGSNAEALEQEYLRARRRVIVETVPHSALGRSQYAIAA